MHSIEIHHRQILALSDMRGNLAMGVIVVFSGAALLRLMRTTPENRSSRRWLPRIALVSGPVVAFAYLLYDYWWLSPSSYTQPGDFAESLVPIMAVGVFGGVVGAAGFWIVDRLGIQP